MHKVIFTWNRTNLFARHELSIVLISSVLNNFFQMSIVFTSRHCGSRDTRNAPGKKRFLNEEGISNDSFIPVRWKVNLQTKITAFPQTGTGKEIQIKELLNTPDVDLRSIPECAASDQRHAGQKKTALGLYQQKNLTRFSTVFTRKYHWKIVLLHRALSCPLPGGELY